MILFSKFILSNHFDFDAITNIFFLITRKLNVQTILSIFWSLFKYMKEKSIFGTVMGHRDKGHVILIISGVAYVENFAISSKKTIKIEK